MKINPRLNSAACVIGAVKEPINFKQILEDVIKGKHVSPTTIDAAFYAACDWQICSCGHLCELIPRDGNILGNPPEDDILGDLGCDFAQYMSNLRNAMLDGNRTMIKQEARIALECHLAIEDRATEILSERYTPQEWLNYINDPQSFPKVNFDPNAK